MTADLLQSLPYSDIDSIDKESLILLGILWCAGTPYEKAEVFLELVNPQGENEVANKYIAANSRAFVPMFDRLFELATKFTINMSQEMAA